MTDTDKQPPSQQVQARPRIPEEILRRRPRRLRHRGAWAMVLGQLKRSVLLLALLLAFIWGGFLTIILPLLTAKGADPTLVAGIVGTTFLLFGTAAFVTAIWNFRQVLGRLRIAQFGTPGSVTIVETNRGQTDWIRYENAQGVQTQVEVSRRSVEELQKGDELTELTDPRSGATFVPEAFEIEFEPISDIRTSDLPPPCLAEPTEVGRTPLFATPLPEETGLLARMVDPNPVQKCGKLHWDDEFLTLETEAGTTQLRWDRAWSVALGAAPVTGEHTELHLRLRERNAGPGAPSIELTTQVPQRQVSRQVPNQEARYAFLPASAFQRLLPSLLLHAAATDDAELARMLTTANSAPQRMPAPRKSDEPEREVVEVSAGIKSGVTSY